MKNDYPKRYNRNEKQRLKMPEIGWRLLKNI